MKWNEKSILRKLIWESIQNLYPTNVTNIVGAKVYMVGGFFLNHAETAEGIMTFGREIDCVLK